MPILPVILWTDALIYLLLAAVAGFVWYVRRHEQFRAPWWRVAQTPAAMSALVVLAVFILIGLLDSVHFRLALPAAPGTQTDRAPSRDVAYAVDVKSALDLMLSSIANRPERTYSAPLATHAYAKETVELRVGNGKQVKQVRDYPRLKYGGAHLRARSLKKSFKSRNGLMPSFSWRPRSCPVSIEAIAVCAAYG